MANWPEELCLQLVELYKQRELLWNPDHKEYMRKNLKADAWRNISAEIGKTPEECKTKIENLKTSYRRERRKVERMTGQGVKKAYVSRWFAFQAFEFLTDINKARRMSKSEDLMFITPDNEDSNSENINDSDSIQSGNFTSKDYIIPPTVTFKQNNDTTKKMKVDEHLEMMSDVFNILKTVTEKLSTPPSMMDEMTLFFKFVSAKVQNYSSETKRGVQHAIFEVLMRADAGFYECTDYLSYGQHSHHLNYSDNRPSQSYTPPPANCLRVQPSPHLSPSPSLSPT